MSFLHTVAAFILALGVLIVVHELGHYWVARLCGVKVLRFSVGFGKPLLMRRFGKDQTEWALAAIPLGGYVKMVDEREGEVAPEDLNRAFNRQSVGKRFAIVSAGPIANFLLAILFYWGLCLNGVPDMKPVLGTPEPMSIAEKSGQQGGDLVLSVNGQPVTGWSDLRWQVLQYALDHVPIQLEVLDAHNMRQWRTLEVLPDAGDQPEQDLISRLGLHTVDLPVMVGKVFAESPAERAGLQSGDRILTAAGQPVSNGHALIKQISASLGKPLPLGIERDGMVREVVVTPVDGAPERPGQGRMGAGLIADQNAVKEYQLTLEYGVGEALLQGFKRTWDMSIFSLRAMGKMLTGQLSWRNLSGPVTIADYAGQSAKMGLVSYINFLALISISLGVLNLLPIPLLDGGHLMYYTIEFLKGSPVSERIMDLGQRAGLAMLLALMVFAFYNDINRLLG
ncbi:MAG TPA: RIP metalloprotease RseP [Burkholderiales bacterium]|nr:RIP metalloprotease RseP [Burkholderiales bacterium]